MTEISETSNILRKKAKLRKLIYTLVLFGIVCAVALWHKPSTNDFILFVVLMIGTLIFLEIIENKFNNFPLLYKRLLRYGVLIAIASIIIPVFDAILMLGVSLLFELEVILKNEE
jgi:hypothetical protein